MDLHQTSSGSLALPGSSQNALGRMQQPSRSSSMTREHHLLLALLLRQAPLMLLTGASSSRVC
jgi:hypothetical protein